MKLAVTATRAGLTKEQKETVRELLKEIKPTSAVNGDAVGGDSELFTIFCEYGVEPELYPSNLNKTRAFRKAKVIHPVDKPLNRNCTMVDLCDLLLGFPRLFEEERRSGTWHAIRYAKKKNKPLIIVWPDGSMELFNS